MKARLVVLLGVLSSLPFATVFASPVLSDSFELYHPGVLDADQPANEGGVNGVTNGANPWWGPDFPNVYVVNSTAGVTPHTGTNMIQGNSPGQGDREVCNLAYRVNSSNLLYTNMVLDWWFYDTIGTNSTMNYNSSDFECAVSLAYFHALPTNYDYFPLDLNGYEVVSAGFAPDQRLALGGGDPTVTNYNSLVYQAQVFNAPSSDGSTYLNAPGWFNTTTARSIGWHHGRIMVPPPTNNLISVAFYVDDMINAAFGSTITNGTPFNCILIEPDNEGNGNAPQPFFDDVSFYNHLPAPGVLQLAQAGTNVVLTFPQDFWVLQSSPTLSPGNWLTLTNALSPYTNGTTSSPLFFRLRRN
jgi:hypothetical protein